MPLTRTFAETDLVNALGARLLRRCGMAATTDGAGSPNPDLNGPLLRALYQFRLTAADPTNVSDADLAQVPPARMIRFLDFAKIMTIDVAKIRLVGTAMRTEFEDYEAQYGDPARILAELRLAIWTEYQQATQGRDPAVGRMGREHANPLDPSGYFPPYPPLGNNPLTPTPPDV
jgi:hypothetical protein